MTENLTHLPEELHPCEHLTDLVSRRSDETLKGPAKWYIDVHVLTCPHCRAALEGLRALNAQVEALIKAAPRTNLHLSPEEWQKVESSMSAGQ